MRPEGTRQAREAVPVASRYPNDPNERTPMTDSPTPEAVRRARMDLAIARERALVDQIVAAVARLQDRLTGADWKRRDSDDERSIIDPANRRIRFQVSYSGGEFQARLTVGDSAPPIVMRITPTLYERQSACVAVLAEIVIGIGNGKAATVHLNSGGSTLGIECDGYLFGQRAPVLEADDIAYPIDQDDAPPDMSGSPGHHDR